MASERSTVDIEKGQILVSDSTPSLSEKADHEDVHIEMQTHPDGGWGWVACIGAFFIQFFMLGVQNSAGIIYAALVDEFKTPRGVTGA